MVFSSPGRPARRLLPVLAVLAVVAGLSSGCAHARAERPMPPRAASTPGGGVPEGVLDPSEEITPEELASIPEPPGVSPRRDGGTHSPAPPAVSPPPSAGSPPPNAAPEASEPRSTGPSGREPSQAPPAPAGPWVWRVQVLATPDRALADRVAREAADRLGTVARVDSEPPLHKVRLGAFMSEADAQVLKQRAVEMGYPGAFRIKITTAATDD